MIKPISPSYFLLAGLSTVLMACGDAKTTIKEKDPIVVEDDHDHEHEAEAPGRLAVLNSDGSELAVFDLEDNNLMQSFALTPAATAIQASAGYRYAVLANRSLNTVNFVDGGLWQEDHVDHLHDYEQAPVLLDYTLSGAQPTHITKHEDELAIFFDGNAETSSPAGIQVLSDLEIQQAQRLEFSIQYPINMHGVAEPRGDHLFATWRRDDTQSTSANTILPDQIAMYHLHDGEYEQETVFDVTCPDLHGAAQNEHFVVFACSDGVVLIHEHEGEYEAEKLPNSDDLADGLRIGSVYADEHSEQFIALASAHGGSETQWFVIDPEEESIEFLDWAPETNAQAVARAFGFGGEQFLILDNQGNLTAIEPHDHDGHSHWQYEGARISIKEEGVSYDNAGTAFSMSISQAGHYAYIADPIAQHVVIIDLELMMEVGHLELGFAPSNLVWLGIGARHDHDEEDDHDH